MGHKQVCVHRPNEESIVEGELSRRRGDIHRGAERMTEAVADNAEISSANKTTIYIYCIILI